MTRQNVIVSPREKTLKFLFSDVQYLKGIGPTKAKALREHGIVTVLDLLFYVPRKYLDRSQVTPIGHLAQGIQATVIGRVVGYGEVVGRRHRYVVQLEDQTGRLKLVWFSGYKYLEDLFAIGDILAATGRVGYYDGYQMAHPEFEIISDEQDEAIHTRRIIPIYRESARLRSLKLHSRGLRRIIKPVLDHLAELDCETLPDNLRRQFKLVSLTQAFYQAHFPDSQAACEAGLRRLSFEELFYLELLLAARKQIRSTQEPGISFPPPRRLGRRLLDNLRFALTKAQKRVLNEIYRDMARPHPMNRLLQGDVGCGKTVVALLTMLGAVEAGYQAALMAPTEVLVEQHGYALNRMLADLDVKVAVLTGSVPRRKRLAIERQIATGEANIVVGTHTLIQENLRFAKLGLVVIDEQHRFGVAQRARLHAKGTNPDVLVMTATPIPRTLAMTYYGDLDVSVINEMPPGRSAIKTVFVPQEKRDKMYEFIRGEVKRGRQAYIVYPLVEESEKVDLKAATESYQRLATEIFPDLKLALLHGRLKGELKTSIMERFRQGEINIIVGTTVIEVGLDVPNATIITIEHAERFGLAQLHQLRGRVGRGQYKSYCFLLSDKPLTDEAGARIKAICSNSDGFKIAEIDLQLRGPGEIMGIKQHGLPEMKVASLTDSQTLVLARKTAFAIIADDAQLLKPENTLLREVLLRKYAEKVQYSKTA